MSDTSDLDQQIEQLRKCEIIKESEEIVQDGGVRKGDSMVSVLFLFLMSAFAE